MQEISKESAARKSLEAAQAINTERTQVHSLHVTRLNETLKEQNEEIELKRKLVDELQAKCEALEEFKEQVTKENNRLHKQVLEVNGAFEDAQKAYTKVEKNWLESQTQLRQFEYRSREKVKAEERQAAAERGSREGESGSAGGGDLQLMLDYYKAKVICSGCKIRERNTIILRCYHTFCRECIDERVASRSRMCPKCNNKFSGEQIHTFWLK